MPSGRIDFFASEEECRALVEGCLSEGLVLYREPWDEQPLVRISDLPPDEGDDRPRRFFAVSAELTADARGHPRTSFDTAFVTLDLPKERDGVLLLGSVSYECAEEVVDETKERSGTVRGLIRELGDHHVVVRSAAGQVRSAPTVRASDGARELFELGWELRQEGVRNVEYLIR